MKPDPILRQTTTEKQVEETITGETQQVRAEQKFVSAEELLRHDRAQTPVPEALAQRLAATVGQTEPGSPPWWRRWL